jgi:hypothetical protein
MSANELFDSAEYAAVPDFEGLPVTQFALTVGGTIEYSPDSDLVETVEGFQVGRSYDAVIRFRITDKANKAQFDDKESPASVKRLTVAKIQSIRPA